MSERNDNGNDLSSAPTSAATSTTPSSPSHPLMKSVSFSTASKQNALSRHQRRNIGLNHDHRSNDRGKSNLPQSCLSLDISNFNDGAPLHQQKNSDVIDEGLSRAVRWRNQKHDMSSSSIESEVGTSQGEDTDGGFMVHRSKRTRSQTTPMQFLDAISALHRAVARKDCITAITHACNLFDHNEVESHNFVIEKGGAHVALFKLLSIVISRASKTAGGTSIGYKGDEVQQLCRSLEMVHRASAAYVKLSYNEVGEDLIEALLHVIERCLDNVIRDDGDKCVLSCVQLLLYYSEMAAPKSVKYMASRPGLMQLLLRVAASGSMIDERGKETALKVIANLDYSRSGVSRHRRNLSSTDILLLDTLIESAYNTSADAVRNNAALGLNNLSCHNEHISTMSEEKVLEVLLKLLRDDNSLTRQYAASTIKNIAKIRGNAVRLVDHGYGTLIGALLAIMESEESDETRRSASKALKDMACADTAQRMSEHVDFVKILAHSVLSDSKDAVREEAAQILKQLSYTINAPMASHDDLLIALIRATFTDETVSLSIIGKALLTQSAESQNRKSIMEQKQLFAGLANMSVHSQHANVAGIIRNLAYDDEHKVALAIDEVFYMLISALAISGEASKYAVRAISQIATNADNKKKLANYKGLIESLVKLCRTTSDVTLRTWTRKILAGLVVSIGL